MWFSFCEKLCKPGASFPINLQVSLTRLENTEDGRKELREKTLTVFHLPSSVEVTIVSSMNDMNGIDFYLRCVQML